MLLFSMLLKFTRLMKRGLTNRRIRLLPGDLNHVMIHMRGDDFCFDFQAKFLESNCDFLNYGNRKAIGK